jgi:GntR family transcriptional regulator
MRAAPAGSGPFASGGRRLDERALSFLHHPPRLPRAVRGFAHKLAGKISDMAPELTEVTPPISLRIADDIRGKIETGELRPDDQLPTLPALAAQWSCSVTSARGAMALLRSQGLISGGRGQPLRVRVKPRMVIRDNRRHQAEKDLALASLDDRRRHGEAEDDLGEDLQALDFRSEYRDVPASAGLAAVFGVEPGTMLKRKLYETRDKSGWTRRAYSVSYTPVSLLEANPELLTDDCEPWPGGAMHQFRTLGIEIAEVVDEVRAIMPTTVDVQRWALEPGVPLLAVRRISIDTDKRVVEVSDAYYPADRTTLRFATPLTPWSE